MDTITQDDKQTAKQELPFIRFRATEEFHKRVRIAAINEQKSVQQLCTEALAEYLDRRGRE